MGPIIYSLEEIQNLRGLGDGLRDGVPCDDLDSLSHILLIELFKRIWNDGELMDQLANGGEDAV